MSLSPKWQYSLKQLTQFTMLNKVLDPLASNINDSLKRTTVILPFISKGLFGTKLMFLTHENAERWVIFFNQLTQFTMLNNVLDSVACNFNGSLTRETVLLPLT
jgi:hypothetical protein